MRRVGKRCAQSKGWYGIRPAKGSFQSIYENQKNSKQHKEAVLLSRPFACAIAPPKWLIRFTKSPPNPLETTIRSCESVGSSTETHCGAKGHLSVSAPTGQLSGDPSAAKSSHYLCPFCPIDSEIIWNRNMQILLTSHWVQQLASQGPIHS